jgi:hypothetical protein
MAEGMLCSSSVSPNRKKKSVSGGYGDISRKVNHNIDYIANLLALRQWYRFVRREFFSTARLYMPEPLMF